MRIGPMIVVGIDNTGRRANEYLPYPDPENKELGKPETQDVHGKEYADFVIKEVMPFIQKKYRVALGPPNTGLGRFVVWRSGDAGDGADASRSVRQGAD